MQSEDASDLQVGTIHETLVQIGQPFKGAFLTFPRTGDHIGRLQQIPQLYHIQDSASSQQQCGN